MRCRFVLFAALLLASLGWSQTRDFSFFVSSDPHAGFEDLKAEPPQTAKDSLAKIQKNRELLVDLVGKKFALGPTFPALPTPKGWFVLGDLTDGHKENAVAQQQWNGFESVFPRGGVPMGSKTVPVFALPGNHDGDVSGPQRQGLLQRNRALRQQDRLAAVSSNGAHFAVRWNDVHILCLGLCPADGVDTESLFTYGKPGEGSWNDPAGALTFMEAYLAKHVGKTKQPVILMHHYGFDGFSTNDWNWWTPKQRKTLYEALQTYNIVAIFHGHNHQAEHYLWPDKERHRADLATYFPKSVPSNLKQFNVVSCGNAGWIVRIRGDRMAGWNIRDKARGPEVVQTFEISLKP